MNSNNNDKEAYSDFIGSADHIRSADHIGSTSPGSGSDPTPRKPKKKELKHPIPLLILILRSHPNHIPNRLTITFWRHWELMIAVEMAILWMPNKRTKLRTSHQESLKLIMKVFHSHSTKMTMISSWRLESRNNQKIMSWKNSSQLLTKQMFDLFWPVHAKDRMEMAMIADSPWQCPEIYGQTSF